jgi:general secretion pathway protein G
VAIIGLVAAIATPNLINALDRSRQKRTMADMRAVGAACEEYSLDYDFFPVQTVQSDLAAISPLLTPKYVKVLQERDGWDGKLRYGSTAGGTGYTVRSLGKDGVKNGPAGQNGDFNCDIVFQDGHFTAYPPGVQT